MRNILKLQDFHFHGVPRNRLYKYDKPWNTIQTIVSTRVTPHRAITLFFFFSFNQLKRER